MAKDNSSSGCGCLLFILICVVGIIVDKCKGDDNGAGKSQTTESYTGYSSSSSQRETGLTSEERAYLVNSLLTGDTPYLDYYGSNYVCRYAPCSAIEVTAPVNSDIVVIIKKNDEQGDVISHAYIRAGEEYSFELPNGTFQPFFYYGKGWNPDKKWAMA